MNNTQTLFRNIRICAILASILVANSANAKDFGIKGHTHKIVEQPFLQMIDERLQKVDVEKEKKKMQAIAKDRINNPKPVASVMPAARGRVFYHDPTYSAPEDVYLPCGKLLHRAGTTVNPLEHMQLNRRLFFVDAREKKQLNWLKSKLSNPLPEQVEPVEDRIILVAGSPLRLQKKLGKTVYFDQQGALSKRFGIMGSPAILEQDGLRLRIEEFKLKKRNY